MNLTATFKHLIKRKIATAVLVTASIAAFATLGDGGKKGSGKSSSLASERLRSKSFSLRTSYQYKGNSLLSNPKPAKFILLNTVVTYQKGNATYTLPLKKKVFLDKVNFNPAASRP